MLRCVGESGRALVRAPADRRFRIRGDRLDPLCAGTDRLHTRVKRYRDHRRHSLPVRRSQNPRVEGRPRRGPILVVRDRASLGVVAVSYVVMNVRSDPTNVPKSLVMTAR